MLAMHTLGSIAIGRWSSALQNAQKSKPVSKLYMAHSYSACSWHTILFATFTPARHTESEQIRVCHS